ncbi:MAG: hypothetical protein J1F37_01650 [Oscillospiraceae bacterium]|nr:hypothetical protein [Oscillospiraceae bacterium]
MNISINELLSGEKIISETNSQKETEIVNKIIKKNDETLIGVIEESRKKIKRHTKISFGLLMLLFIQMIVFFVVPNFLPSQIEPAEMIIALSAIVSVCVGLSKNKLKWLFPLVIMATFFLINLFYRTEEGFIGFAVSLFFAVGSIIIISVCSFGMYLFEKLHK